MPDTKRKRRRLRRLDRVPVSASLLLDERLKDDVGLVSEDLFRTLFPSSFSTIAATPSPSPRYAAIAPWVQTSETATDNDSLKWTIIPVQPVSKNQDDRSPSEAPHSSIRIPASSAALQSFSRALRRVSSVTGKNTVRKDTPYEIRVVDVVAPRLDTVFVTLNSDALVKHYESQIRFGGGFPSVGKENGIRHKALGGQKAKVHVNDKEMETTWRKAVKEAFSSRLVYTGDQIHLPLPAHPISHVPAPPVKITACEPASQGLCHADTQIVLIKSLPRRSTTRQASHSISIPEEDEDTGNEQFYSAAEDRNSMDLSAQDDDTSVTDISDTQSILTVDNEDLSDDPDDLISLSTPMLPPQTSGILSGFAGATPRAGGFHSTGIGTPGSVHSSFSSSTVRGGQTRGKVFKAQGLLKVIPDDLLHPKPSREEDEEARVFVDTSALVRIGCFSGDWVKIEETQEPHAGGLGLAPWTHEAFQEEGASAKKCRPVKVYALPDGRRHSNNTALKKPSRQTSFGFGGSTSTPSVYLPPLLLANLSATQYVRISPLSAQQLENPPSNLNPNSKITSSSMPPAASEVKILKILTPLSQDLHLQPVLFAALKNFFEGKKRVLKTDDIIAISFDEADGRALYQAGKDSVNDELSSMIKQEKAWISANPNLKRSSPSAVAWFKVATVASESSSDDIDWAGAAYVASSSTKLIQKANEPARLPPTLHGTWQYYYGVKAVPASSSRRLVGSIPSLGASDPHISSMRRRLRQLIAASTSARAVHMRLPPMAILLTSTQQQIGKAFTVKQVCDDIGLHFGSIGGYRTSTAETGTEIEEWVKQRAQRLLTCGSENTVLLFENIDAFPGDRMLSVFKEILADSRVIVATSTDVDKIPEGVWSLFTHELEFTAPDEGEREGIVREIIDDFGARIAPDVELSSIALKTAALVAGDLKDVVKRAIQTKQSRLQKIAETASMPNADYPVTLRDLEIAGGMSISCLTKSDFDAAVDAARKNFADAIGAPKIPNVGWDDVGGLAHVKEAVMETIQLPLTRPELFAKGMKKRSGILFYGPPGTGKTLLAKAIATEFSLNFFSVKGPELLNMYIGESEANVRRVFQRARDARPCVVFFDELDSVAPKRGNQGDSGGVMDRIVSQLLAELDGMSNGEEGGGGVFVIGATNRPDLLDQALLRPGRFDKMLYLGISDTHDKQLKILEALTRKFTLHPQCSLKRISDTLPFTFTGADLYALCSDAMLKAITRQSRKVDEKVATHNASLKPGENPITIAQFFDHYVTEDDLAVTVTEEDFHHAHKELVPSVSAEEFAHYEKVRMAFEGNDAPPKPNNATVATAPPHPPPSQPLPRQPQLSLKRPLSDASSTLKSPMSPMSPMSPPGVRPLSHRTNSTRSAGVKRSDRSTFYFEQNANEDDEEEYVIRTDHLGANGFGNGDAFHRSRSELGSIHGSIKGKRKTGKFGSATDGDEDMYQ